MPATGSGTVGQAPSYRAIADDLRLRLIVENIDSRPLPGQVICPDTPGEEFQARWQKVPVGNGPPPWPWSVLPGGGSSGASTCHCASVSDDGYTGHETGPAPS
jgi:hypothetical protein